MAFPSGWQRKVAITCDNALCGASDSSDFTVLLTRDNLPDEICSPTDANRAQSDGGDIRFSSDDSGATQLAVHIERWEYDTSDAARDADVALNVKVPTLTGTGTGTDTTIYCWYNTSGTESQPSADDTYGAKNAYDQDHCHVIPFREDGTGSAPQFTDVVGGRNLTVTGTAVNTIDNNGLPAFGTGSQAAIALSEYPGFITPNNGSSVPCTNTGLCYIPGDEYLGIMNFDDNEIIEVDKDGTEITRFALTQGEAGIQGIAYDSVADQFAVCDGGNVRFYDRDGTFDRNVANPGSNHIAYDVDTDSMWSVDGSYDLIRWNKTTGAILETVAPTDKATVTNGCDGITYASSRDSIFVTHDTGRRIYEVSLSTGATLQNLPGPVDIEHPAWDETDDTLWVNADARFHSGANSGENVVYKLSADSTAKDWRSPFTDATIEFWCEPTDLATTTVLHANWPTTGSSSNDHLHAEIQYRSGGALLWVAQDGGYATAGSASSGNWHYFVKRFTNSTNTQIGKVDNVTAWTDATVSTADIAASGRIGFGARPDDTLRSAAKFSSYRLHRVARSDSWLTARYNNTDDPAAFASAGSPEDAVSDAIPPAFASAEVPLGAEGTVVVQLTEADSVPILPATGITGFSLTTDYGTPVTVVSAARTGNTEITLTTSRTIYDIEGPQVAYSGGNVTDSASNAMLDFGLQGIVNNSGQSPPDTTAPTFASAQIPTGGTTVVVTLSETESAPLLPAVSVTGFSLSSDGGALSILSAFRSSSTAITLCVDRSILGSETVTVAYSSGNVTDSASSPNSMADFAAQAVTNNSTVSAGGGTFPAESEVLNGVAYGAADELRGNVVLPSESVVNDGVEYGANGNDLEGSLILPLASNVRSATQYGVFGSLTTGTLELPAIEDVENGVQFGAGGTEFTGTLLVTGGASSGSSSGATGIAAASLEPKRAKVDGVEMESHSVDDMIKADKYAKQQEAAKSVTPGGIRFFKTKSGGSSNP